MIWTSEIFTTPPAVFRTPLEREVYAALERLDIPFERIDNDPAVTMDDCAAIDAALNVQTVKTLLLCNRQQTCFYLYVTPGDKAFVTKDFGAALGISRVSFAPESALHERLGTVLGATTVFSCLTAAPDAFRLVMDRSVAESEWYGCTDGTTTCYMRLRTADLLERLLPQTPFVPTII